MTEESTVTPSCPKCGGEMWDNRENKRNPRAPDFKCKDKNCEGVIWPPRDGKAAAAPAAAAPAKGAGKAGGVDANGMPLCPTCGGPMWDDRESKRNPRAPDFKCRNKPRAKGEPGCEGVIWPSRDGAPSPYPQSGPRRSAPAGAEPPRNDAPFPDEPPPFEDEDDLPF